MSPTPHVIRRILGAIAVTLATFAAIVGSPVPPSRSASAGADDVATAAPVVPSSLGALQLAAWIREGARDVRVLDLRGDAAYESHHIPSAQPIHLPQLDSLAADVDATLVLYSDDDVRDIQAWANLAARGHRRAYVLNGGMSSWTEEVMEPVLHGDSADYVAALSRYFGGTPRAEATREKRTTKSEATTAGERAAADTDAFGEPARRGC
jgi:rhodanese-related sulfurtransferase